MIKKRIPAVLLAFGAAIALAGGGGTAYWLSMRRVPISELPVGVDVVPQDALLTVSFSTNQGQWRKLRQFGTAESQAVFAQNLAELRDRLLTANGFDYEDDIEPWIGEEVTVAFLPPATATPASSNNASPTPIPLDPDRQQQAAVIVLPIANQLKAQELLTAPQGAEPSTREYKGLQIQELAGKSGDNEQTYAFTVLDQRLIVVSTDAKAIEQVIDTYKGAASIVKTPGYNQAWQRIEAAQPFMRVYINVPQANALSAANAAQPLPTQGLTSLQSNQGIVATATLESEGIRFQGLGWLKPDSETRYTVTNTAERMPGLLPAETLVMTSGGNLKQLWEDYSKRAEAAPAGAFSPDRLREGIVSTTGLDVDQDLIPWMNGEFALALLPIAGSDPATQSAGILLLVQATDRRAADAALTKLDEAMKTRYGFEVSEGEVEGTPVVNWKSAMGAFGVTRGWLDGNVAFLALGAPIANDILPQPDKTLAADQQFRQATASKLDPNNGHFFANLDRLTQPNSPVPFPQLPPDSASFVQAIRSIGVTGAVEDDRTVRYDILVLLEKTREPAPLPSPTTPAPDSASPSPTP
jgi:Protein of unknown function (DUF3352)